MVVTMQSEQKMPGTDTWGLVLLLEEAQEQVISTRPERFGKGCDLVSPLAQFREWPAIYEAANAANLCRLGQDMRVTLHRITDLLYEHYSVNQVRQLPLSNVAAFLRGLANKSGAASQRTEEGKPSDCQESIPESDSTYAKVRASNGLPRLKDWAIGIEGPGVWHVFHRFGGAWRHQGRAESIASRRQEDLLRSFAEGGGLLSDDGVVKWIRRTSSGEDTRKILKCIKPDISRLRKVLRMNLKITDMAVNPLPRDRHTRGWQSAIEIGYAVKNDDEGRLEFMLHEHLSAEERLDR
jgi:hypothetical protein